MTETNPLKLLRTPFGVSQQMFASYMGVPLRTYEALERDLTPFRMIHMRAAELAALRLAQDRNSPSALPPYLREVATDVAGDLWRVETWGPNGLPTDNPTAYYIDARGAVAAAKAIDSAGNRPIIRGPRNAHSDDRELVREAGFWGL